MTPLYCIVQSNIDYSGVIQAFGCFETEKTANDEITSFRALMAPSEYLWSVVPIWDVN